jgi:aminopeptidase N
LQIAAAAPASVNGNTFDYELHNARRFAWSASGHYEVLYADFGEIPVSIYFLNEHRDAAEASLRTALQALEIYSELYGAYPYESLSIVDALFFDGMESDGIFFLDQGYFIEYNYSPRNYLTALTAHEVAHNWWFGQVGNDQALEPWLDEALCIYSELLYYENTYPEMIAWWWEFRIDRFRPAGLVDSSIYDFTGFEPYVHAVYMRGAQFLQDLRTTIGDGAFFGFMRDLAVTSQGRIIHSQDFFSLLSHHSTANIAPLVSEYFGDQ